MSTSKGYSLRTQSTKITKAQGEQPRGVNAVMGENFSGRVKVLEDSNNVLTEISDLIHGHKSRSSSVTEITYTNKYILSVCL